MGIEYVDCLTETSHQRAIDLVNIIGQDLNEVISLIEDVIDNIIHFHEIGDEMQFIFWNEVHHHIILHYIMVPSNDLSKPDHMFI
ncbi:hypothetical protein OAA15_00730 [bacterium]|nr:hypothetical protein [bacterium]